MAKQRHEEAQSSKTPIAILAIGALLVAGLVVWALTRTVEPAATTTTGETAAVSTAPAGTTLPPPQSSPSDSATAPIASATAPITATSTAAPPPQADRTAVQRISAEDLRNRMANVVIVDVRDASSYQASHIAGAIHIPMSSIQTNLDLIPKGKDVVTYCT